MSRAFVKENDDWEFCEQVMDTCWFAKEDGSCPLEKCIRDESGNCPEYPDAPVKG